SGITDDSICGLNDVMRIDGDIYENYQGIEYQAFDIQVTDTLPPDEFLKENFIRDTYPNLTEYVNEDGSLKPHARFTDAGSQETESAEASFIIVTTKIRNTRGTAQKILLSGILMKMTMGLTDFPSPGTNRLRHRKAGKDLQPTAYRSIRVPRIMEGQTNCSP